MAKVEHAMFPGLENIVIFSKISDIFDLYISSICTYIAKII